MLKKENGLGVIGIITLIAFICAVVTGFYYIYTRQKNHQKDNDIKSNMLLIQGACSVLYENCVMNKTVDQLIGTKLSQSEENEEIDKDIIKNFKEKNIIPEDQYEKYYILTDNNLEQLKVEVKNENNSYYVVCYETEEIIITAGYNGKYKLSDITPKGKEEMEDKQETIKSEEEQPQNTEEKAPTEGEETPQPEQNGESVQKPEEQQANTEEG